MIICTARGEGSSTTTQYTRSPTNSIRSTYNVCAFIFNKHLTMKSSADRAARNTHLDSQPHFSIRSAYRVSITHLSFTCKLVLVANTLLTLLKSFAQPKQTTPNITDGHSSMNIFIPCRMQTSTP